MCCVRKSRAIPISLVTRPPRGVIKCHSTDSRAPRTAFRGADACAAPPSREWRAPPPAPPAPSPPRTGAAA
eukprot:2582489-Prymnesium_polylepis.1